MLMHRHLHKFAKWIWWINSLKGTENHSWPEIVCIFGGFVFTCVHRFVQVCTKKNVCMFDCLDWLPSEIQMQDPPACNPVLGLQLQSRLCNEVSRKTQKARFWQLPDSRVHGGFWRVVQSGGAWETRPFPHAPALGIRSSGIFAASFIRNQQAHLPWGSVTGSSRLIKPELNLKCVLCRWWSGCSGEANGVLGWHMGGRHNWGNSSQTLGSLS